jgi:hypothetical protein
MEVVEKKQRIPLNAQCEEILMNIIDFYKNVLSQDESRAPLTEEIIRDVISYEFINKGDKNKEIETTLRKSLKYLKALENLVEPQAVMVEESDDEQSDDEHEKKRNYSSTPLSFVVSKLPDGYKFHDGEKLVKSSYNNDFLTIQEVDDMTNPDELIKNTDKYITKNINDINNALILPPLWDAGILEDDTILDEVEGDEENGGDEGDKGDDANDLFTSSQPDEPIPFGPKLPGDDDEITLLKNQKQITDRHFLKIYSANNLKFQKGHEYIVSNSSWFVTFTSLEIWDSIFESLSKVIIDVSDQTLSSEYDAIYSAYMSFEATITSFHERISHIYKFVYETFLPYIHKLYDQVAGIFIRAPNDKLLDISMKLLDICSALFSGMHHTQYTVDTVNGCYEALKAQLGAPNGSFTTVTGNGVSAFPFVNSYAQCYDVFYTDSDTNQTVQLFKFTCAPKLEEQIKALVGLVGSQKEKVFFDNNVLNQSKMTIKGPALVSNLYQLKYYGLVQTQGAPVKVGTENVTKNYVSYCVSNFLGYYDICKNILSSPSSMFDSVKESIMTSLMKYIQLNGDHFFIMKFSFPDGMDNMCPAPLGTETGNDIGFPNNDLNPVVNSPGFKVVIDGRMCDEKENNPVSLYAHKEEDVKKMTYNNFNMLMNLGTNPNYQQQLVDSRQPKHPKYPRKDKEEQVKIPPIKKGDDAANNTRGEMIREKNIKVEQAEKEDEWNNLITINESDDQHAKSSSSEVCEEGECKLKPSDALFGELSWTDFQKYLENYMVNYCKMGQPSLKMVTFLKMMILNSIMVKNNWGFIDLAGGSLMNFLQKRFVVTADYDNKIYFNPVIIYDDPAENDKVLKSRQNYIKICAINLGTNINNYLMRKEFFKTTKIQGVFGFKPLGDEKIIDLNFTFDITPPHTRYFSSRGKEPELFPVSLYSSDFFLSVKLYYENKIILKSTAFTLGIAYEDLVFKLAEKHYLYKPLYENARKKTIENVTRVTTRKRTTNDSPATMDVQNEYDRIIRSEMSTATFVKGLYGIDESKIFTIRIPSLWEIQEDINSLLTVSELLFGRKSVSKHSKDVARKILVGGLARLILEKNDNIQVTNEEFLKTYPIEHAFPENKDLYFQTQLFKLCCPDHGNELVKLIQDSIDNPFTIISHMLWSMVALTKKYSDFRNMSDYLRLHYVETFEIRQFHENREIEFDMVIYQELILRSKYAGIENSYYLTYKPGVGFKHDQGKFITLENIPDRRQIAVKDKVFDGRFEIIGDENLAVKDRKAIEDAADVSNPTLETYANKLSLLRLNLVEGTIEQSLNLINDAIGLRVILISGGSKLKSTKKNNTKKCKPIMVKSAKITRKNMLTNGSKKSKRRLAKHSVKKRKYTRKRKMLKK